MVWHGSTLKKCDCKVFYAFCALFTSILDDGGADISSWFKNIKGNALKLVYDNQSELIIWNTKAAFGTH